MSKVLTLSGTYTHHSYASDTLSVLAGLSSTLALVATISLKAVAVSLSSTFYFGGGSATYIAGGLSTSHQIGHFNIHPSIQASFVSQTVDVALLPKNRGIGKGLAKKAGAATPETITGLSSLSVLVTLSYPLGKGFTVSLTPSYLYAPTDLASWTSQLLLTAGMNYSLDF